MICTNLPLICLYFLFTFLAFANQEIVWLRYRFIACLEHFSAKISLYKCTNNRYNLFYTKVLCDFLHSLGYFLFLACFFLVCFACFIFIFFQWSAILPMSSEKSKSVKSTRHVICSQKDGVVQKIMGDTANMITT